MKDRLMLQLQAEVNPEGMFEILAITAGVGNGWEFPETVLEESLPLWDGAACYVDHSLFSRSIRDLAGICSSPVWQTEKKGIQLTLNPSGPGAELLKSLGREMLREGESPKPQVGFSADIFFTSNGKTVQKILRVQSVDLVMNPARGGTFLRELQQEYPYLFPTDKQGEQFMEEKIHDEPSVQLQEEAQQAQRLRLQMCTQLLESTLASSQLPKAARTRLRKQFEGRLYDPDELKSAVDDTLTFISEINNGAVIEGPGRIESMHSSRDQLQAAVDDLLEAPRDDNTKDLKAARLSGIRELYMMLTGDYDLHGGYHREHVQLATTADFTGLVKNALNKIVVNTWDALGRAGYAWWQQIARVEHFNSLQNITGTLVGTVGDLPVVDEGDAYTELSIGDSPETASFTKYGGYIPLSLELIDRDETRKLKAYPRELASAGLRKISALVAAIFTANSGVGPDMADTGALFNNTAVTSAGGHANLLTDALTATSWEAVCTAVYNQPMLVKNASGLYGSGPSMAINPRYLLVPRALQLAAMKILYPGFENSANIYSENMQRGKPGDVITVPEWTDANNWAAICDPVIAPAIYIGERFGILPEIFIAGSELNGSVFDNDEHRLKVRHFLAVWVNDFRPLHKNNVA